MGWNRGIFQLIGVCLLADFSTAALIVPQPSVNVENVTSYSITLNWTLPVNELYDGFSIEIHADGVKMNTFETDQLRLVVSGLTPGNLYAFLVRTYRADIESDTVVVLQDTIPLPPTNLRLEYFDELIIDFGIIYSNMLQFSLNLPGIEAEWDGPQEGHCDCYTATISPNDGRTVLPVKENQVLTNCREAVCKKQTGSPDSFLSVEEKLREDPAPTMRQFIHLIPGKKYTVSIRSTTCGNGQLGPLESPAVSETITLPPADPTPITSRDVTNTSAYLSWEEGDIPGFYEGFEVLLISETEDEVIIELPSNPRVRGRQVTGLSPCTTYEFRVFTINVGIRSTNSETGEVNTKPMSPYNLKVTNFNERSISLAWRLQGKHGSAGVRVFVKDIFDFNQPTTDTNATLEELLPGTIYNPTITTFCSGSERTESDPVSISQVTVPLPPSSVSASCSLKGDTGSLINLSWKRPVFGGWDGFIVDYSPFIFAEGFASPMSPVSLLRDNYSLNVTVPVSGRKFTAMIRSARLHVSSIAALAEIDCDNAVGSSIRRCRVSSLSWNILITLNQTHACIEVTDHPIHNITVETSFSPATSFVTADYKFCILNPCNSAINSEKLRVIIHPQCKQDEVCPPLSRKLCPTPKRDGSISPTPSTSISSPLSNACCNGKQYNTHFEKCCHGKLAGIDEEDMRCCYTRWYDSQTQRCCGKVLNEGVVRSSAVNCVLVA